MYNHYKKQMILLIASILTIFSAQISFSQNYADLVLKNGKIITVDSTESIVQAVAVKDSMTIKVGSDTDVQSLIGPETQVVNLQGKTVTPGLIDAHGHLLYWGQINNDFVNLRPPEVISIADIVVKISAAVSQADSGEWVIGDGFLYITEGRLPTRYDIDPVSPNNPVLLNNMGGHFGTANSYALELAGIDSSTKNPVGGIIEKDTTTGQPTGVLWNHPAMDLVRKYYPEFPVDQLTADAIYAQDLYISLGITSFQDVNTRGLNRIKAYVAAVDSLKPRGYLLLTIEKPADADLSLSYTKLYVGPKLSFGGDKFLLDGQPPTSYTYEAHPGPSWNMPTWNPDTLKTAVKKLHRAGHQLAFHVMGDHAIDLALDAIEEALTDTFRDDHRHRLEHCMIPTVAAVQRMKRLGVIASFQPAAIWTSGEFYIQTWETERMKRFKPIKTMLDLGIHVALGSDFPTVPQLSPLLTLQAALVRKTAAGTIIGINERISIQEALRAHTMGSAYAAFEENIKGSIEAGKYADMVVWSGDLYTVEPANIKDLQAEITIVGGVMYKNTEVGVKGHSGFAKPRQFILFQNYPNPFNAGTEIGYQFSFSGSKTANRVTIEIYNIRGQKVKTLVDEAICPGYQTVRWDGKYADGRDAVSGVYFYRLKAGNFVQTKKLILMR